MLTDKNITLYTYFWIKKCVRKHDYRRISFTDERQWQTISKTNTSISWADETTTQYIIISSHCPRSMCVRAVRTIITHKQSIVRYRSWRVECPLKSVQYQFAPVFTTVVFNPLAPGSARLDAINLPYGRSPAQGYAARRTDFARNTRRTRVWSGKNQSDDRTRSINFPRPCAVPSSKGRPPNYRRRLWQTARAAHPLRSRPSIDFFLDFSGL